MSVLDYFFRRRRPTASVAKERLQIILSHERARRSAPEFLPALQQDIIQAVAKYFPIDPEGVTVQFERRESCAVLELNIALPAESALPQGDRGTPKPHQQQAAKNGKAEHSGKSAKRGR